MGSNQRNLEENWHQVTGGFIPESVHIAVGPDGQQSVCWFK